MPSTPTVVRDREFLRVTWPDSHSALFHPYWLRENCHCSVCTHQDAWERLADLRQIPLDITVAGMSADRNGLGLEWPTHDAPCEGTIYSWDWLDAHRTETDAVEGRRPKTRRWRGVELDRDGATVSYNQMMDTAGGLKRFLEVIEEVGVGFLSGCPTDVGTVTGIAGRLGFVENSQFGGRFDVESKPAAENLAYTAVALPPHNDLSSREHLPGVQLLLCLENSATGGESILVDALAAAERLRTEDTASFDLLVRTPVTFTSIAETWHIVNRAPIIATDSDGRITGTRVHPALIGPVDVAPR